MKPLKHKYEIRLAIQHMAAAQVLKMVDEDRLAEIKKSDPNPMIKVFAVGETGKAKGNIIGGGQQVMHYVQQAIQSIYGNLRVGLKGFFNHGKDNSHSGREPIGEVVGRAIEGGIDTLTTLAAIYIYPEHKDKNLDVASIEAELVGHKDDNGNIVVDAIESLTGIALGNSQEGTVPGFPGATLRASVQAFVSQTIEEEETDMAVKLEDVKEAIKKGELKFKDLFTEDELKENDDIKKLFVSEPEKKKAKPKVETEEEEEQPVKKGAARQSEHMRNIIRRLNSYRVPDALDSIAKTRKLKPEEVAFIKTKKDSFQSDAAEDDEDSFKEDLNTFVDRQLAEVASLKSLFGVKEESKNPKTEINSGATDGTQAADGAGNEYLDPKKNPLIPS